MDLGTPWAMPPWMERHQTAALAQQGALVAASLDALEAEPVTDTPFGAQPRIPQGTVVGDPDGRHVWAVVGSAEDGMVSLRRQGEQGIVHGSVDGATLIRANPALADGVLVVDPATRGIFELQTGRLESPRPGHLDAIPLGGPVAAVHAFAADGLFRTNPHLTAPVTIPPDDSGAEAMAALGLRSRVLVRDALVGTPDLDGGAAPLATESHGVGEARAVGRAVDGAQAWFLDALGLDASSETGTRSVTMNDPEFIGSGAISDDGTQIRLSPRGDVARGMLSSPGLGREQLVDLRSRLASEVLDVDRVLTHELGHATLNRTWGSPSFDGSPADSERRILDEALSDMFEAVRYASEADLPREPRRLVNGWGSYTQVAERLAAGSAVDVHDGTQVVTRPIVDLARIIGWADTGDLLAATIRRGEQELVTDSRASMDMRSFASDLLDVGGLRLRQRPDALAVLRTSLQAMRLV